MSMDTHHAVMSDPRDHPDNAHLPNINSPATIIGTSIAFLTVALCALSLRLYIRFRDRLWGWDDALLCLAGVASFVGDIMVCQMPADGLGLHLWTLDDDHLRAYFKHIYTTNASYSASATLIKLAILFQYLRLFAETAASTTTAQYRLARRATWTLITLSGTWGLSFFLLALFPCHPIAKNWEPDLTGKCIGWGSKDPKTFFAMFMGHAVSNSVLDLCVLTLPLPFLTMLRLAGKSKAALISLFTLGGIVGIVAVGRIVALSINRAGTIPKPDMTFYTPIVFLFGVLEVNIAILAASIPIFWPHIATLATNKIFVVNEIEVHVEHVSRNDSFDSSRAISLSDRKPTAQGETSKLGVVTTTFDDVTKKSTEKQSPRDNHQHTRSNASSIGRTMGLGSRPSQDSQRHLYRIDSSEHRSSRSLTRSDGDDWFLDMDKVNPGGVSTTKVEGTNIPFNHRKSDN